MHQQAEVGEGEAQEGNGYNRSVQAERMLLPETSREYTR
jgi:hypothetical protein